MRIKVSDKVNDTLLPILVEVAEVLSDGPDARDPERELVAVQIGAPLLSKIF